MNPWKGVVSGLQMFRDAFCFLPMALRIVRYGYPLVCDPRHGRDRRLTDEQDEFQELQSLAVREPLLVAWPAPKYTTAGKNHTANALATNLGPTGWLGGRV